MPVDLGSLPSLGLLVVVFAFLSYAVLLFVLRRFTYRTWIFHVAVGLGMGLALISWALGGSAATAGIAVALGGVWYLVTWRELSLVGSKDLNLRRGDAFPAFTASTTDGRSVTERELAATAPTLLVLYRGWWCPSSRAQYDELVRYHQMLSDAGLTVFAGSVDSPAESAPIQDRVGDKITILCDIPTALLEAIGVCDERGAPWYDRLLFGAARREISMPAAIVIDEAGRVAYAYRSKRVDARPQPADILAAL